MHEEMGGGKEEKMSVLVKGMEMPEKCDYCPFYDDSAYGDCTITHKMVDYATKPDDCPLISIPPHGDLIDRDELLSQYGGPIWTAKTDYAEGLRDVVADIKNAPTIIEAEPCNDLAKPNNDPTVIEAEGRE